MSPADDPGSRSLRRDAERNRQRILEAADRLVSERGLDIGHNEIAREAGLGVYRRYPDRQLLLDDVFFERVRAIAAIAERTRHAEDAWQGLSRFLEEIFEMQADDRGLREFMSRSGGSELVAEAAAIIQPAVGELVRRAHEDGTLRPDVGATDIPLIPMMVGAVMDGARGVAPELWRRVLALVLDGLSSGSRPDRLPGTPPAAGALAAILSGGDERARAAG